MVSRDPGGSLVARVVRTLHERALLPEGSQVVVACSGGPDSVAMLDVLERIRDERGLTLLVASVDHGLRPAAADEVRFVGELARGRGLAFAPLALQLPSGTTQARARTARYGALRGLAAERFTKHAPCIAVGHTRDDQAETVLARLLRGSGLHGLRGIRPRREDGVARPLLDVSRLEVRAHLAHFGLPSIEDPSNADRRYLRVRVRASLLPSLAAESPVIASHLASLADEAETLACWVEANAARFVAEHGASGLDGSVLDALAPPVRARAIAEIVAEHTGRLPGRRVRASIEHALVHGGSVWIGANLALEGPPGRLSFHEAKRIRHPERPKDT